jgi:hypothetical protein
VRVAFASPNRSGFKSSPHPSPLPMGEGEQHPKKIRDLAAQESAARSGGEEFKTDT